MSLKQDAQVRGTRSKSPASLSLRVAALEEKLSLLIVSSCEGNGFPLHTIFLRDHTHFARLLTLRSPD